MKTTSLRCILTSFWISLLIILISSTGFTQTVNYEVKVTGVASTECDDCSGNPELRWRLSVSDNKTSEIDYWSLDGGDCTPNINAQIFTNKNNIPHGDDVYPLVVYINSNAWEYDTGVFCPNNDGDCGGYAQINSFNLCNGVAPNVWHAYSATRVCDGVTWTFDYEFRYDYEDLSAGSIARINNEIFPACEDPGTIFSTEEPSCGPISIQWQSRPLGGSWSNISGATEIDYSPGLLCQSTSYRRRVGVGQLGGGTMYSYTSVITVIIDDDLANCHYDFQVDDNPINPRLYKTANTISSTGSILNNSDVVFSASNTIDLGSGFEISAGSTFEAVMDGCVFGNGETDVQTLLDNGYSPVDIYAAGSPATELIGKEFEGGIIFYIDTDDLYDFTGLVTTPTSLEGLQWGNVGTDFPNVPNVISYPPSGTGSEIGDGYTNSINSPNYSAAYYLLTTYNWWLPSTGELLVMRDNLQLSENQNYWSSTEFDGEKAWTVNFAVDEPFERFKSFLWEVRPIWSF